MAEHGIRTLLENLELQLQRGIYQRPLLSPTLIAREAMKQLRNHDNFMRYIRRSEYMRKLDWCNAELERGIYG